MPAVLINIIDRYTFVPLRCLEQLRVTKSVESKLAGLLFLRSSQFTVRFDMELNVLILLHVKDLLIKKSTVSALLLLHAGILLWRAFGRLVNKFNSNKYDYNHH